ncbi:MAG: hypothetical protein VX899_12990 [Myxococcota bacterium]|nr:hypothetical protein [Myxococcota bacterium]
MWLLYANLALAHPAGGALPGHHLSWDIGPEGVRLHQWTRIPVHHVLESLEPSADFGPQAADAYVDRKHRELMQGLVLKVDGELQSWTPLPDTRSSKGNDVYLIFEQELWLPLEPGDHALSVRNENLADMPGFFRVEGEVSRPWVLLDSSLHPSGTYLGERWSLDESLREVTFSLRAAHRWERALRSEPATLEQLGPTPIPSSFWVLAGSGVLLGLGASALLRRHRSWGPGAS